MIKDEAIMGCLSKNVFEPILNSSHTAASVKKGKMQVLDLPIGQKWLKSEHLKY